MSVTTWKTLLVITTIIIVVVYKYATRNKELSKLTILSFIILTFTMAYLGYRSYHWYNKKYDRPFSKIETGISESTKKISQIILPLPIEKEPAIKRYLMSTQKDRPIIIGAPREVQIKFTDPLNPTSPHAVFQIVFENKGTQRAQDINIEWDIKDMGAQGQRITPPDEWARITGKKKETYSLGPRMGFLQIYGPEIGAYAQKDPPNIEVAITVTYKDIKDKQYSYYCRAKTIIEQSENRRYFFNVEDIK